MQIQLIQEDENRNEKSDFSGTISHDKNAWKA